MSQTKADSASFTKASKAAKTVRKDSISNLAAKQLMNRYASGFNIKEDFNSLKTNSFRERAGGSVVGFSDHPI